ncbi:hypothetical protein HAX54_045206, partial [Datura stramonium]|nr:hypothetical protein [Datura stramonium]
KTILQRLACGSLATFNNGSCRVSVVEKEDVSVDECSENFCEGRQRLYRGKGSSSKYLGSGGSTFDLNSEIKSYLNRRFAELSQRSAALPFALEIMPSSLCHHRLFTGGSRNGLAVHR